MPDPDLNLLLHGASAALPEQIRLRAGPLTLVLEAGDLRYISLGRREVVRRIYGAVRDRDWRTVRGQLSDVVVSSEHDRFHASYRSEHRDGAIDFVWRAAIEGRPDGTIAFAFSGEARSTFESNRIGLCVLHPMRECAGRPARARLTTGTELDVQFPELVAVEQPIHLIALLGNAARALAAADVTLALENHDRFSAATLRRIIESAGSPHAGICLDTANSLGAGEGLAAVTETLAPLTVNLHVKDVRISRLPHMMGFVVEGRPLGQGQLPIAETIACVRQHGRCGSVILEAWTPPGTTMEETVTRERAAADISIERLKTLVCDQEFPRPDWRSGSTKR
jgi:sugar phosphate isomerase/epimerase